MPSPLSSRPLLSTALAVLTALALFVPQVASAHPRGRGQAVRVYRPHGGHYVVRRPGRHRVWVQAPPRYRVYAPRPYVVVPPPVVVHPRYRYEVQPQPQPREEAPETWQEEAPETWQEAPETWQEEAPETWDGQEETYEAPTEVEPELERTPQPAPEAGPRHAPERRDTPSHVGDERGALEQEILRLVNLERQRAGLSPLRHGAALVKPARAHSREMLEMGYFSHTSPVAKHAEFTDRLRLAGVRDYGVAGENLAMRSRSADLAAHLVKMWMDSPGHRRNILEPRFRYLGVGVHGDDKLVYATQLFTSKLNGR